MDKQQILLKIVRTWDLNEKPEYMRFRCANCQNYIDKAWHHWLNEGGYQTPVHFCDECEKSYKEGILKVDKPSVEFNKDKFHYNEKIEAKLREVSDKWDTSIDPGLKNFTCDNCGDDYTKMYHICWDKDNKLVEVHLCKKCGDEINLND